MKSKTKLNNVVSISMLVIIAEVMLFWWTPIMKAAGYVTSFIIAAVILGVVGWFVDGIIVNLIWAKWGQKKPEPVPENFSIRNSMDVSGTVDVWKWWEPQNERQILTGKIVSVGQDFIKIKWWESNIRVHTYAELQNATGDDIIYKKV